jgi:membrane fusion protein (multidrug efflux system)
MPDEARPPTEATPPIHAASTVQAAQTPPHVRWPLALAFAVVIVFAGAMLFVVFRPGPVAYTDDAYVAAHYATIAPRISGQISSVEVDDNQRVSAGQVLAVVDDRDYRVAVAAAEAQLERDRAQVDDAQAAIDRQPSVVRQSTAQLNATAAELVFAQANQQRYSALATTGAGTQQDHQRADAAFRQAAAAVAGNKASEEAAQRQIPIQEAELRAAQALVRADEARLEQARLNLSYTRVVAPIGGTIAQRAVQVGNFVSPGTALMAVVPTAQIYIEANYREVLLRHMLPGQHARIHVDAYDLDIAGVVDGLPPASGAAFAPIEPNNATGNFTKIVQRLPVKIIVSPGQKLADLLRIGLSVETYVDTNGPATATPAIDVREPVAGQR